jgi:archaellum component FlaF (FlaF/FlaG flagellin family)
MIVRSLATAVALGVLTLTTSAFAKGGGGGGGGHHGGGGYIPWQGIGFGYPFYGYGYPSGSGPQQASAPPYDLAPAVGNAAFTRAEFENRWADLQVMLARARDDFQISADYLAAKHDYESAQVDYEAAVEAVLSRVHDDPKYKQLAEKRTEERVIVNSTGVGTGVRNVMAVQTMHDGSMVTLLEAQALEDDSAVSESRIRLVSAHQNLVLKEKLFESQLYNRPGVVAARTQMETARANKAGAEGYLNGAIATWMGY